MNDGPPQFEPEPRREFLPRLETLPQIAPVALLTISVSRDNGRTWEGTRTFRSSDNVSPLMGSMWPPCACRRCRMY
ncbi:hypothetical protein DN051_43360 (plasmid) [Streptomyces cadmiisoli]|uniref:Uncharacterized protein n=1 Tax=Streptomyces cadmiisoli TaxID=2184053 RepID=A0A2Z4JE69_9ACTN|nr:hypothetical protein DN051_43360 [Streptomyces cadmiisoli]